MHLAIGEADTVPSLCRNTANGPFCKKVDGMV